MTTTIITTPISGDYRIDVLLDGPKTRLNASGPYQSHVTVTYSFPTFGPIGGMGFAQATTKERDMSRQIFTQIASDFNIDFTEVSSSGQIQIGQIDLGTTTALGTLPIENHSVLSLWFNSKFAQPSYNTVLHEIGHILGLKHPADYGTQGVSSTGNTLASAEDSSFNTVMSYYGTSPRDFFGPYDFLALNFLYGARQTNLSDDTYKYSNDSTSAYFVNDTSGNDTIDLSACTYSQILDLNAGRASNSLVGPHIYMFNYDSVMNLGLAPGTVIENGIGGDADDIITGNSINNNLAGGPGNDTIKGGAGNDTINGGTGTDTAVLSNKFQGYAVAQTSTGLKVIDKSETEGTDTLTNIEHLKFSNASFAFNSEAIEAAKLIQVALGPKFLNSAHDAFKGKVLSYFEMGQSESDWAYWIQYQPEFKYTNSLGNHDFIKALWKNTFGTPNISKADMSHYLDLLDHGGMTHAGMILDLMTHVTLTGIPTTGLEYK